MGKKRCYKATILIGHSSGEKECRHLTKNKLSSSPLSSLSVYIKTEVHFVLNGLDLTELYTELHSVGILWAGLIGDQTEDTAEDITTEVLKLLQNEVGCHLSHVFTCQVFGQIMMLVWCLLWLVKSRLFLQLWKYINIWTIAILIRLFIRSGWCFKLL